MHKCAILAKINYQKASQEPEGRGIFTGFLVQSIANFLNFSQFNNV
jgi:hypothetical protein